MTIRYTSKEYSIYLNLTPHEAFTISLNMKKCRFSTRLRQISKRDLIVIYFIIEITFKVHLLLLSYRTQSKQATSEVSLPAFTFSLGQFSCKSLKTLLFQVK